MNPAPQGTHSRFTKTTSLLRWAGCESAERLRIWYTKMLDVLEEMPKNVAYRKYTKQTTSGKLDIFKVKPDVKKLEDHLQGGQIEEMILQAENELNLVRIMVQWKPWEPFMEEPLPTNGTGQNNHHQMTCVLKGNSCN